MNILATMKQALEALERSKPIPCVYALASDATSEHEAAISNLSAAIEQIEKAKPVAHLHRTGSNVIECVYKGAFCPADGHQLLSNDLPLNRSVPLYSLEDWK